MSHRHKAEQVHVVGRAGAGVVGPCQRVAHEPQRGLLQPVEALLHRFQQGGERFDRLQPIERTRRLRHEGHEGASAVLGQLAADEVERLDAVGALVDHGDAGIADELLHAPFGDIAVPAEHLLGLHAIVEAEVGQYPLQDGRH